MSTHTFQVLLILLFDIALIYTFIRFIIWLITLPKRKRAEWKEKERQNRFKRQIKNSMKEEIRQYHKEQKKKEYPKEYHYSSH